MGDNGTLKKMSFRFRNMVFSGDRLTCKGKVTEKRTDEGQNMVTCDLSIENQKGDIVLAPASVSISF